MAGAGADWNAYNLPSIWSMIQTEDACTGADRVLSWMNLAAACRDQHRRLLAARDDLAEVWPPEKNSSARVFLRQLDLLAASLDQTLTRAEDTRVGLQGVFDALGAAQGTIRPLAQERAVVADDLVPRFVDHAEDEYDERARQAMRAAEAAIGEHGTQIQAPALYRLVSGESDGHLIGSDDDRPDPGAFAGGGSSDGALRAVPRPVAVPHDPPAPSAVAGPPADAGSSAGPGLGLAGVVAAPPLSAAGGGPPAPAPPGGQVPGGTVSAAVIGAGAGLPPTVGGVGRIGPGGVIGGPGGRGASVRGVGAASGRQGVGLRRPLPAGAVIGSAGPVGGLGGRAAPGKPAGGSGSARQVGGPGQLPGGAGRHAKDGDGDGEMPAGAVDQRWGVLVGVAPVIAANTAEPTHDPGPGVIGLDR
jgi:hypothetical protein